MRLFKRRVSCGDFGVSLCSHVVRIFQHESARRLETLLSDDRMEAAGPDFLKDYFAFLFFSANYVVGALTSDQHHQILIRTAMLRHLAEHVDAGFYNDVKRSLIAFERSLLAEESVADAGGTLSLDFASRVLPDNHEAATMCARLAVQDYIGMTAMICRMFEDVKLTE